MRNIKNSAWLISALFITLFASCKKDKETEVVTENFKGALIINEGGFGKSNASIGLYKPGTGDYFEVFKKVNGRPLGDVIQSITLIGDRYYIIVNNSNKIEVVNKSDFKSISTINVNQPRYILQISATKAYVSQMGGTTMSVLNLTDYSITKTFEVKSATENMALMNGRVYVGKSYGDKLYVINDTTDVVIDSLTVGSGLNNIVTISSTQIAVFCSGYPAVENGKIAFINKDSVKIAKTVSLSSGTYGGMMVNKGGILYYNTGDGKIYSMLSSATTAPASPIISLASGSIYGFAIDPLNSDFYLLDAGDFNSAGKVYIYNSSATFVKQFNAGIAPSKVMFNY